MTGVSVVLLVFCVTTLSSSVIVVTSNGALKGTQVNGINQFLAIPYAKPPVGSLRWKSPVPADNWSGVRDASQYGTVCYQPFNAQVIRDYTFPANTTMSEDCLYLNVWTPDVTGKLPVMFWIHGGGLANGGNSEYRLVGSEMSSRGVVVVNINYRLGLLGFLANQALRNEDPNYPSTGNYGLEDQRLAMKWLQENIHKFGGDPKRVTIMGESAGGSSVCLHLLMPKSAGLFHQAVIESGACFDETRFLPEGYADSELVFRSIGCNSTNPADLLKCAREASPSSLIAVQPRVAVTAYVDDFNIEEHPFVSLQKRNIASKVPLLVGSNLNEGTVFIYPRFPNGLSLDQYKAQVTNSFKDFAPSLLNTYRCETSDCRSILSYLFGDSLLTCPTYLVTQALAETMPVYSYLWVHEPSYLSKTEPYLGAFHSSEIVFVFSTIASVYPHTAEEVTLASKLTDYWTSFGISGSPTSPSAPAWPSEAYHNRQTLNITKIYATEDTLAKTSYCDTLWTAVFKFRYSGK